MGIYTILLVVRRTCGEGACSRGGLWAIPGPVRLTRRPAGLPTDSSLRSASVVNGACQIKVNSRSKAEHGGLKADLSGRSESRAKTGLLFCGSWLACDGINCVSLTDRDVCIAGKAVPTFECVQRPGSGQLLGRRTPLLSFLILGGSLRNAGGRAHRAWARCRVVGYFWLSRHFGLFSKSDLP